MGGTKIKQGTSVMEQAATQIDSRFIFNVRRILQPTSYYQKYALGESFVFDGWRYWTDGRIAFRCSSNEPSSVDLNVPASSIGDFGWPADWTDAKPFPKQPERILYEKQRHSGWNDDYDDSRFRYGELEESAYEFDGTRIDPRYFCGIVNFLKNPRYIFDTVADAAKKVDCAVFVKSDECEMIVMPMAKAEGLFTVSQA